jgi:hypothetical protein
VELSCPHYETGRFTRSCSAASVRLALPCCSEPSQSSKQLTIHERLSDILDLGESLAVIEIKPVIGRNEHERDLQASQALGHGDYRLTIEVHVKHRQIRLLMGQETQGCVNRSGGSRNIPGRTPPSHRRPRQSGAVGRSTMEVPITCTADRRTQEVGNIAPALLGICDPAFTLADSEGLQNP